jgi:hypothetical protein
VQWSALVAGERISSLADRPKHHMQPGIVAQPPKETATLPRCECCALSVLRKFGAMISRNIHLRHLFQGQLDSFAYQFLEFEKSTHNHFAP